MKKAIIKKDRKTINCDKKNYNIELDKKGYFLIKIDSEKGNIYCGYVEYKNINGKKEHVLDIELFGKKAENIIKEIAKQELCENMQHMGYIAYELCRAEKALKSRKRFVQR